MKNLFAHRTTRHKTLVPFSLFILFIFNIYSFYYMRALQVIFCLFLVFLCMRNALFLEFISFHLLRIRNVVQAHTSAVAVSLFFLI